MNNPYAIIKSRYVTEKTTVLEQLHNSESNPCVARCTNPKYIFLVDTHATKPQIAKAIEAIYKEKKVKVSAVNTVVMKPKRTKRGRGKGKPGAKAGFKKAIITLETGDVLDEV
ncbi:MAG: hypothetical protein S4CHLAM45_12830 [Chlamydiales bacterium]|nr:hypothetical protein [Chlamydiales bacterium]MCH9619772.1 hypothetical protein [Chlamydiales bacterium]MCH9623378.1 hypothetical protein [Chlamydiales bacterium]